MRRGRKAAVLALTMVLGCVDEPTDDDPQGGSGETWGYDIVKSRIAVGESTSAVAYFMGPTNETGMPANGTTWSTEDGAVIMLSTSPSASVTITGLTVGTATLVGHNGGKEQHGVIEVVAAP